MIRFGLVGVGAWGKRYAETISRRSDCRLVAFARARADAPQAEHTTGLVDAGDFASLLARAKDGELDAIIVATNPEHQAEAALAAATARVPALVEKPLGTTLAAAQAVQTRALETDRPAPLIVDYVHLWSAAYRRLQSLVAEAGGAESVAAIETEGCSRGPFRSFSSLYDYSPHDLAMLLGIMGVDAPFTLDHAERTPASDGAGEIFDVRGRLSGVPVAMRVGNGAAAKSRRFAVRLRDGRLLVYDDLLDSTKKLTDGGNPVAIDGPPPLDGVIDDLVGQIGQWRAGAAWPYGTVDFLAVSVRIAGIMNAIVDACTVR